MFPKLGEKVHTSKIVTVEIWERVRGGSIPPPPRHEIKGEPNLRVHRDGEDHAARDAGVR